MITKESFECERCGECCMYLIVKVSEKDIEKIKEKGYDNFYEYDKDIRSYVLKRDDRCIFLKKDKGYSCSIYDIRPKACKDYPFGRLKKIYSCKPQSFARNLFK